MKYLLLFFTGTLMMSFYSDNNYSTYDFIPLEYLYPEDSLKNGKTFVVKSEETGNLNLSDITLAQKSTNRQIIVRRYSNNSSGYDSTIFFNHKMTEIYSNMYSGNILVKAKIISDMILNDGSKLGTQRQVITYTYSEGQVTTDSKSTYLKDTILNWNSVQVACLVVASHIKISFQKPSDPEDKKDTFSYSVKTYYGKNLGTMRFTVIEPKGVHTFNLVKIVNKK